MVHDFLGVELYRGCSECLDCLVRVGISLLTVILRSSVYGSRNEASTVWAQVVSER